MEFSKKLITTILITWISTIILVSVCSLFGKDIKFILDYVQPVFITSCIGYLGKSGTENVLKIKANTSATPLSSTTQEIINNINSSTNNTNNKI